MKISFKNNNHYHAAVATTLLVSGSPGFGIWLQGLSATGD